MEGGLFLLLWLGPILVAVNVWPIETRSETFQTVLILWFFFGPMGSSYILTFAHNCTVRLVCWRLGVVPGVRDLDAELRDLLR